MRCSLARLQPGQNYDLWPWCLQIYRKPGWNNPFTRYWYDYMCLIWFIINILQAEPSPWSCTSDIYVDEAMG